jgi:hypothetical protein
MVSVNLFGVYTDDVYLFFVLFSFLLSLLKFLTSTGFLQFNAYF